MNDNNQMPVPTPSYEVRQGAMLCHLAAFLGFVFPFGSVVGPLILWQMKKEVDPFVDDQGKEALNFQITVAIAWLVCLLLGFVVIGSTAPTNCRKGIPTLQTRRNDTTSPTGVLPWTVPEPVTGCHSSRFS